MEEYANLKKGTRVGLIVSLVLVFVGLAFVIHNIVSLLIHTPVKTPQLIRNSANFVMFIAILFYAFVGYKKPHGNMLRGLFFAFGAIVALYVISFGLDPSAYASVFGTVRNTCEIGAALIIVYVSGRLNKIEKNKKLLFLAGALMFIHYIMPFFKGKIVFNSLIGGISPLLILFALGFAYTARFEEHKAAAPEDN